MNVEIICPLYNAEKYVDNLQKSLKKQLVCCHQNIKSTENTLRKEDNYERLYESF